MGNSIGGGHVDHSLTLDQCKFLETEHTTPALRAVQARAFRNVVGSDPVRNCVVGAAGGTAGGILFGGAADSALPKGQ